MQTEAPHHIILTQKKEKKRDATKNPENFDNASLVAYYSHLRQDVTDVKRYQKILVTIFKACNKKHPKKFNDFEKRGLHVLKCSSHLHQPVVVVKQESA